MTQLVEALLYKPESRGFDSQWVVGICHLLSPTGRAMAVGSTQPLTDISTRSVFWGVKVAGA